MLLEACDAVGFAPLLVVVGTDFLDDDFEDAVERYKVVLVFVECVVLEATVFLSLPLWAFPGSRPEYPCLFFKSGKEFVVQVPDMAESDVGIESDESP